MHFLEEKIRKTNGTGRPALIPFLTAGFPDRDRFWETLGELDEHGADVIEIGVPFSDPVADGPVVEAASRKVLSDGVNLAEILRELALRKGMLKAGIVLMGYYNPFLQYGLEKLAEDAANAGVHGFIVPDLPYDEAAPMRDLLKAKGIALIPLVGPNTGEKRMQLYAQVSEGYVYVVSVMGITGAREGLPPQVEATIRRARKMFSLPVALGFGLKEPSQLLGSPPEAMPDAAVFGSALLTHIEKGKKASEFMERWL